MRNFKFKTANLVLVLVLSLFILMSCNTDESPLGEPPVITKVSTSIGDVETTQGYANNFYIVRGSGFSTVKKVYFNETDTYFNPTLVTETVIIVRIDENTPYENASNELRIVNDAGTAVYPFIVAPPAPTLKSFNPINALEGETVIISGSFFLDPVVTVGNVEVTPVSSSLTEIEIVMPANANHKYITVETISGESISKAAVGTAIFDDVLYYGFSVDWGGVIEANDDARQGNNVITVENVGGWGSWGLNWPWPPIPLADYPDIRMSIKSDNPGKIEIIYNGDWSGENTMVLDTTSEWTDFVIPISTFDSGYDTTQLKNLSFKNATPDGNTYYFDNMGFTID